MSKTAIVKTGEQFFIKQLSRSQPIKLDKVIFANINGTNGDTEIDLNGSMPAARQIVHTAPVTQSGLLNDKTVVYSVILDTSVGDFSFNYIGLANSETNTLCMVMHTDLTRKVKTAGQRQGNTITESIWLEIDNASESTGITVNAQTWQIDYSKRLAGEDERIRLTNYDLYNRLAIHDGFTITKNNNQLTVSSGLAYVAGLRVNHTAQTSIKVENNQSLYIDAWLAGTVTGEWSVSYNLIAGTNLRDYEKNGFKHYVERVASVDANGKLVVVKPKSFITTYDHATTEKTGIVKLSSEINSTSETDAATSLAVKKIYDLALKNCGDLANTSINNLTGLNEGIYFQGRNAQATTENNYPINQAGTLQVFKNGADGAGCCQIYTTYRNARQFVRNYRGGTKTWEPWVEYYTTANKELSNIINKFQPLDFESVIFSPDKQYHATVRNDGIFGFFDRKSTHQNLSWAVDATGGLVHGYVNVDKIRGLEDFINNLIPVGIPMPWPTVTPPPGWLACNGWKFDKNKYPKLAQAYPSGFLPDVRANTIRGLDAGRGIDVNRVILSEQGDAMRNLTGTFGFEANTGGNTGGADVGGVFYSVPDPARRHLAAGTAAGNNTIVFDASRQAPIANEFRVRSIAFLYIVRAA